MKIRRISFSSRAVVEDPFQWAYELEENGYTGWEIVQEGSQCLNSQNIERIKEIKETTNLELTLHLPFSDMNLAGLNPGIHREVMRQMKSSLELACDLVELAVVHPGYLSPHGAQMPGKAWKGGVDSIKSICDIAYDLGIMISVENMPDVPGVFGKTPDDMTEILEAVDRENAGFTFDVGHANTLGLVEDFVGSMEDRITHVHIHDNMGRRDEHLPIGDGSVDWSLLMQGLSTYRGIFVTEMGNIEEGIRCLEFIRQL
jgi:sugar phosphate isomerase/epimerase